LKLSAFAAAIGYTVIIRLIMVFLQTVPPVQRC
jgi:hypothetical protein